ncbi:hypothetical protein A4A49_63157, partial [Nicotiana attenuata]
FFTEDQYKQLVNLLQKTTTSDCSTNTAGIIALMANVAANNHVWIVDSGATHHVTHCKNALSNLKRADHRIDGVQLPSGNKEHIAHTGDIVVIGDKTIEGVLYVPDFKFKLLSISKLTGQLCYSVGFYPDFCIFQGLYNVTYLNVINFTVRATKAVLIGSSETQKGYRLYDLENRSIFVSRDVVFKDEIFHFGNTTSSDNSEDLFTSQHSFEAGEVQQPHTTVIPTTSQDMHFLIEDNTPTKVETTDSETVINNVISGGEHENAAPTNENSISEQAAEPTAAQEPSLETTEEASMHAQPASTEIETRKSSRQGKPSICLKDYIT